MGSAHLPLVPREETDNRIRFFVPVGAQRERFAYPRRHRSNRTVISGNPHIAP